MKKAGKRTVVLREEHKGDDHRYLRAHLDEHGGLHIEGHDLGPGAEYMSPNGEYEWNHTIAAADVPKLVELLGGRPDERVLDVLGRDWTGPRSRELEDRISDSDIDVAFWSWRG